jgi:hypothetical protein
MATPTYTLIDSEVLASAAASVTFSSIPADYRDLVLVIQSKSDSGNTTIRFELNGDTGSNYTFVSMLGVDGGLVISSNGASATVGGDNASESLNILQFMDYSATDKHKTVLSRQNRTITAGAYAVRWANTAAINQILMAKNAGLYAAGSSFYLYGIAS